MSMHRLFAEQLRCATDATGQVDLVKLASSSARLTRPVIASVSG
ncbi:MULTISPECIES: hypothetical protein [unclassified Bradyrhizobium]|nr:MULTISPECIES: hypothetical protein [unclassified Bradyrhizobium]